MSQYIAGLNQIPQETDFTLDESYNFEDDLALFTNTEFIHNDIVDFDLDFDFTQTIPGEEEYLKQDQLHQQAGQELPQQQEEQEDLSSGTNPIISSHIHNSIPPPPPSSPQLSVTSVTIKKQKLSDRSGKATKQEAIVSASPSSSSLIIQEESDSTASTISSATPAAGSTFLAISSKESLGISIPSIDANPTSHLGHQLQEPSVSLAGNGEMNFDGGTYRQPFHNRLFCAILFCASCVSFWGLHHKH